MSKETRPVKPAQLGMTDELPKKPATDIEVLPDADGIMRYELAKSAIAGIALHGVKVNLIAERAVEMADAVIAELKK